MELDFDKEIDALLRQSAQGSEFVLNQTAMHLDADEISAFAENALPERAKQRSMLHLADCESCRKTLSHLILLNVETESETVRVDEKQSAALPIRWHRKLFAFPNLAYAMGALVLVFSGIVGYTVLQNAGNSRNAEVSQISEKRAGGKAVNSDGEAIVSESYSSNTMSSNMMSNSASMNSISNMAAAANLLNPAVAAAPMIAMNSNAAVAREDSEKILRAESKSIAPQEKPTVLAETQDSVVTGAPPKPVKENDYLLDGEAQKQQSNEAQNSIAQNQTNITPDSRNVQSLPMLTRRAENKSKKLEESRKDAREKSIETTSVGGKTFKRENNVWYDSAYRQQPTTNVTRGTKEYKKLDSGLRGIAENLGGTAIIVWKEKAYRIQ
jgi:hypothetical protein